MSVVGIDLGSQSCYIAIARAGGIETVANEYSDRCTPSYVSLNETTRSMGVAAKQQAASNYKNTLFNFKHLLGRSFEDPLVQAERKFLPYAISKGEFGRTVIQASYMNELQQFRPEQVVAMLLTKLKQTAETALKAKVVDCVVSVPSFFVDAERRALLDACQMAGLNALRIMNDTTAVALAYGIYKQDLPAENEKSRNVVFVNMGHVTLQVSACAFNKGKLRMLAVASAPRLGGRDFDRVLVNYFNAEFKEKYKIDPSSRPKAFIRLSQECEKLKKLMSANSEVIPFQIECLMDDVDVSSKMDRAKFEELCEPLLKEAEKPMLEVLAFTKFQPQDLNSVEIIGGSCRIPAVKRLVKSVFGLEPSTTMNADEVVARGCALQAAILSPTFRVRDFSIMDCQPYSITMSWQGSEDNQLEIFPQFHQIPYSKMLTFFRKEPFQLTAFYSHLKEIPYPAQTIGNFKVQSVMPQPNGDSTRVKIKLRVDLNGIFSVVSAAMMEKKDSGGGEANEKSENMELDVDQDKKELMEDGESKSEEISQENKSGQNTQEMEDTSVNTDHDSQTQKSENNENKQDNVPTDKKNEPPAQKKPKKITKMVELPVECMVPQMSRDELNMYIERENQMIMQDKMEKDRADAKNAVEEYVYDMRDKMYGSLESYAQQQEQEKLNNLLEETEDWLYGDGEDQLKQVYIDKLSQLKKLGQPILDRFRESSERPAAFEELGATLQLIQKALHLYSQKDEKYAHIEALEMEKVEKCFKEKMEWFEGQQNLQNQTKLFENPVVLVSQIRQQKQSLESICSPIINKPKPKVEPPKEETKTTGQTENNQVPADEQKTPSQPETDMEVD